MSQRLLPVIIILLFVFAERDLAFAALLTGSVETGNAAGAMRLFLPGVLFITAVQAVVKQKKGEKGQGKVSKQFTSQQQLQKEIAERKRMEEELRAAHQKLLDIIEFLPDATFVIDKDKKVTAWNRAMEEMTGVPKKEIIGKGDYVYSIPLYGKKQSVLIDLIASDDQETKDRYDYVEKRGNTFYAEAFVPYVFERKGAFLLVTASPLFDNEGNVVGAIESIRDITERKLAEEKLQHTVHELRKTQSVVIEREKLAIIGQMAAGMAHEIRNPLTSVRGFAQLLKEKCPDNDTLENYVSIIIDEVNQANSVITNFLQLARPKQPVLKLHSVNELIGEILTIVEPHAFINNIELTFERAKDLPLCMLDRDQIKQVLLNMCRNAIEAMPDGGKIAIASGQFSDEKEIFIDITDTGCGIPKDKMHNIGVPFYSTKDEGTGLGLSISYSIIHAHKGRVEVKSTLGRGTRFRIILPYTWENEKSDKS
ncbi:MAG: PAS domain S-box protein [Clostridia bacterium]|nr:PAS domain S-box protein [Clostridia bacterium]